MENIAKCENDIKGFIVIYVLCNRNKIGRH